MIYNRQQYMNSSYRSRTPRSTIVPTPKSQEPQKQPYFQKQRVLLFANYKLPRQLQSKISLIELNRIQQAYILYCDNKTRLLNKQKIGPLLRSLGLVISNFDMLKVFKEFKVDKEADLTKILEIYSRVKVLKGNAEELDTAIRGLAGMKGEVDVKQLKADMTTLGDIITEQEFNQVIKLIGVKGGKVNCQHMKNVLIGSK